MTKALWGFVSAFTLISTITFAHGNAVHVTGIVAQINGKSVTVQPIAKGARAVTFTVADHTEIDRGKKVASLADLKVGDRVVVEIPKGKTEAESIKIGPAVTPKATPKPADQKHKD